MSSYGDGDRGYNNRGGGGYNDRRGGYDDRGSTYSTHSGSSGGSRSGYQGGGGRGGYGGDREGRGGGRGDMYSQQGNRGGSRVQRNVGANMGDLAAGSAQNPNAPVPKRSLAHTKQEFEKRPKDMTYDKKSVGTKTELWTNHALVHLPKETIQLWSYNIEVFENNKPINKREEAGPLFHTIVKNNIRSFEKNIQFIFNDVNILWTNKKLPGSGGRFTFKRSYFEYKFVGRVDLGEKIREDQDMQMLATLLDAIATARARTDSKKYVVFKRCMFMIQDSRESVDDVMDFPLTVPIRNGLDARVGISIAFRLNLRAGITACYDVHHTLFTRPGYPLVLLLCEMINEGPISKEQFETEWDQRLRTAVVTDENVNMMSAIMKKMRLRYSFDAAVKIDEHGRVHDPSVYNFKGKGIKAFKFYQFTDTSAELTFFRNQEGVEMSVAEYFLKANNIRLRYPNLPLLVKKPTKQNQNFIAYPMELVSYIEDCKRYEGPASTELKADLINYTSYEAPQRLQVLRKIIGQVQIGDVPPAVDNKDRYMTANNVTIDQDMLSVNATILPVPTLLYGEGSRFTDEEHTGAWEAVTHDPIRKVLEGSIYVRNKDPDAPKIKKRLLGSILEIGASHKDRTDLHYDDACYHRLMCALDNAGQPIAWENKEAGQAAIQGKHKYWQRDQTANGPYSIVQFFENLKNNIDPKYKESEDEVLIPFVLVIFEVRCSTYVQKMVEYFNDYNFMKYHGDNETGIYTQGILLRNFSEIGPEPATCKLTRLMVEKILGKIGTTHRKIERGGTFKPWTIFTDPESPTLVLGVDVSHPSKEERKFEDIRKLSAAAVVGNIDIECSEFRSSCRIQEAGDEQIVRFKDEISARINDFIRNTGKRPAHIVMYRDGISENDFQRTLYEEGMDIERACVAIDPAFQPTITYIVATKRHHTRFFLKEFDENTKKMGHNILPGTLVEDTVTTKDFYDFFLCSQIGETGVARPVHYYVLRDNWRPNTSFWPCITFALTYAFCRSTSTVALPAPLLYAHLAAKRAKETLDGAWSTAILKGQRLHVDNVESVNALTTAINVNKGLDGMIFV